MNDLLVRLALAFLGTLSLAPTPEPQQDTTAPPSACTDDDASMVCVASNYIDVLAKSTYNAISLPAGWYRLYVNTTQKWSYSPNRWYNAFGDPYKTNTGGCMQPIAHFDQLITYAKTSASSSASKWWVPFTGNGQKVYHPGGNLKFLCNDRPGEYGDNAGWIRVTIVP